MSFYRQMDRARHHDERLESVGPVARAVFDYLCCNTQDDLCGLYKLRISAACEDTGWSEEQILGALAELEGATCGRDLGLVVWDPSARVVWIPGMFRRGVLKRDGTAHPKMLDHTTRHLESLPRTPLKARFVGYVRARYRVDIGYPEEADSLGGGSFSDSPSVSVSDSVSVGGAGGGDAPPTGDPRAPDPDPPPAAANSGLVHELDVLRRALGVELGSDPPDPMRARDAVLGLTRAVSEHGWATVRDVAEWTWRQHAADPAATPARFVVGMFAGAGFEARLAGWRQRPASTDPADFRLGGEF